MKTLQTMALWAVSASLLATSTTQALADEGALGKIHAKAKNAGQDLAGSPKSKAQLIENGRQLGLALFEFKSEYGSYPDERTATEVIAATGTAAEVKATSANDCLFQLVASGIVLDLRLFSFDKVAHQQKPGEPALLKGLKDCAFSYVTPADPGGKPDRLVLAGPLVKGKTTFDSKVLGGKAVILVAGNMFGVFPIEKDGRVLIDGKDVFDPTQPIWNGTAPTIKWPEP